MANSTSQMLIKMKSDLIKNKRSSDSSDIDNPTAPEQPVLTPSLDAPNHSMQNLMEICLSPNKSKKHIPPS